MIPALWLWPAPSHRDPLFGLFSLGLHSLQETYEAKRKEFLSELQRKEEEMRQMFVNKVKAKYTVILGKSQLVMRLKRVESAV